MQETNDSNKSPILKNNKHNVIVLNLPKENNKETICKATVFFLLLTQLCSGTR